MPACQIEDYRDDEAGRAELIAWLVATDTHGLDAPSWHRRLAHWWDENPFSTLGRERGWVLRHEGRLVGYMGLIPVCYAVQGEPAPACMASTWRVEEPHRNASLPMFMRLRRLGSQHLVVDSTPTPAVQELMQRCGWTACCEVRKHFLALGLAGRLLHGGRLPSLSPGQRLIHDAKDVKSVAVGRHSAGVAKWVSPESLAWFTSSPMRQHVFVGVVDAAGCLTSHLVLTPTSVRGLPAWLAVDHFTARSSNAELHALVGAIVRGAAALPGGRILLSLGAFPGDATWDGLRVLYSRQEQVCHYFLMPEALKGLPKLTVLAEGDWGL